ncbi:hypothetical protein [Desulfonatronum sp. SC1]|uniref:hypothetical protein n=1 Tax=Desulfonatronum sp. SC1 TaxID=2109626 RepID=UPI000D304638|nr:hypothetical protein [Desulfonatronum sp. SC1]PTN37567.1 hypothetical protein C6366_06330 [Desulfonatronum sp. SC1]
MPETTDITAAGISVDELNAKIDAMLAEMDADQGDPMIKALQDDIALRSYHVEGLVNEAAQCFPARTALPARMNRFPLKYLGFLHRFILRFYEALFREQRGVNLALIKALRESMAVNRQLNEQVRRGQHKLAEVLRDIQARAAAQQAVVDRLESELRDLRERG